jgi:hypothetical protein
MFYHTNWWVFTDVLGVLGATKQCMQHNRNELRVIKDKDRAIPLQAWTGPEGSRRLSLPDFKTIST